MSDFEGIAAQRGLTVEEPFSTVLQLRRAEKFTEAGANFIVRGVGALDKELAGTTVEQLVAQQGDRESAVRELGNRVWRRLDREWPEMRRCLVLLALSGETLMQVVLGADEKLYGSKN